MKFDGGSDSGPLTPKIASWIVCPGRAFAVSTTRFGALKPLTSEPPVWPSDARQLAVHPDLGVVVDDDLEDDRGAGRLERADALRDRDADAIPVEAQPARCCAALSSAVGSIACHCESSKPAAPALGAMSWVLTGPPDGLQIGPGRIEVRSMIFVSL